MQTITVATTNKGKLASLKERLKQFNIQLSHSPIELPEIQSENVSEISIHKAIFAFKTLQTPVITDDSGFYIESLGGFPQTYTKPILKTIGIEGFLKLMEGHKNRAAEFRSSLAYMDHSLKKPVTFEHIVKGRLSESKRGEHQDYFWSDLFYIFIPEGHNKTLAEMTPEEYSDFRMSYATHSLQFAKWYTKLK